MKHQSKALPRLTAFLAFLLLATFGQAKAQNPSQQNPTDASQAPVNQAGQVNQAPDLIGSLNLTPDQIQKWRAINADLRVEQQGATQRLRQARRALAEAIESPTSNEELVKQRAKDLSDAQAANTQLQALRESRILQILTPDQRIRLREIRRQNQQARRANMQQGNGRQNGLQQPNNNGNAPLRPNQQRKLMRQKFPKR